MLKKLWEKFWKWMDEREDRAFLRSVGVDPKTCRKIPEEEIFPDGTPGHANAFVRYNKQIEEELLADQGNDCVRCHKCGGVHHYGYVCN